MRLGEGDRFRSVAVSGAIESRLPVTRHSSRVTGRCALA